MHILIFPEKKYRYFIDRKHFNSNYNLFDLNGPFPKGAQIDFSRISI